MSEDIKTLVELGFTLENENVYLKYIGKVGVMYVTIKDSGLYIEMSNRSGYLFMTKKCKDVDYLKSLLQVLNT